MERQLIKSLGDITNTIKTLNNDSKFVGESSANQDDRDQRKLHVLEEASKTYNAFAKEFTAISPSQTQDVLSIALKMLWKHFPGRPGLENKVGNPENPGDGLLYNGEYVTQAKSVLQDLDKAWRNTESVAHISPPLQLPDMSKICLILTGMQRQDLLVCFLESRLSDSDLCLDEQKLRDILTEERHHEATLFYTEQFRAKPGEWVEGSHRKFRDGEPMPLVYIVDEPIRGSYGLIMTVKDCLTGDIYVRKQQRTPSDEQLRRSARKHMEQETQRLKGLRHRHVVQLVKSYERGDVYGLLLKPAANSDLGKLLERYKKDKFYFRKSCTDSVWLRPVFYTAFGCLAQGLAYIHARKLRHKDIKPNNILYEQALRNSNQTSASIKNHDRFLWADFGLAYDFSDKEDSKTRSTKLYSPRYAPPEVIKSANTRGNSKAIVKLDDIIENEDIPIRAEMNPEASDEVVEAHGRAADIFALGCVYFELLSRLVEHDLPLQENHENRILFSEHIERLCEWATEQRSHNLSADLQPLFNITVSMIDSNPERRPEINKIVHLVMKASEKFFCPSCLDDQRKNESNESPASSPIRAATPSPPQTMQRSPRRRFSRISSGL